MESVAANLFPVNPPAVAGCGQEEGLEALGNVLMRKVQDLVGELVTPNVLNMESIAANLPPVNPPAVAGCSQEGLEALGNDLMIKLQDVAGEHVNILESHTWQNIPESHTPQNILDSLTPYVRKHVEELRQLQVKHYQLVAKFHKERSALEAKYLKHYDPLYTKRYDIVNGGVTNEVAAHAPKENGVPNFWMNAMKNNRLLTQEITEHDEGALRCLKDIKLRRIENFKGFELEFIFDKKKNPFFENDVLTKTYHMVDEGDSILLEATGTNIEWYPGKCLTERSQKKKPNKRSKPFAFNVAYKSFFNFFNPPRAHKDDMQQDFSVGVTIRDKIIPYAVSWFTGEALQDEHEDYDKYLCDGDEGWQASSLESLSPDVWKHVEALKQLQVQHDELQAKFLTERALLEAEYQKFYEPIYSKRYDIVNGVVEVEGVTNEEEADEQGATDAPKEKGVPNFWMNAMKNHKFLAEEIRKQDEEALQYLKDIKCCNVENSKGFELQFFFGTNLFFKNDVLTKTYNIIGLEETILEKAIGTEIEWYPGKCLTHKRSTKSKKRSKYAKPFTFSETCESFFNFFNPEMFDDDDDEEREHDYKVGCTVQTEIIPYAVSWFTGEAVEDDDGR